MDLYLALQARANAARDLESAAHALVTAFEAFRTSSDQALAAVPDVTSAMFEHAKSRHAAQFAGSPPSSHAEINTRLHAARAAGQGAANAVEVKLGQALAQGFGRGSAAETLGYELTPEAAEFLRLAVESGKTRPANTTPDGQFASIITAQHTRLLQITQESS